MPRARARAVKELRLPPGLPAILAHDFRQRRARASGALHEILGEYAKRTGNTAELFTGTSPGAWQVGTAVA